MSKKKIKLDFTCKKCGEPVGLSKTNLDFGFDCKNSCAEIAYNLGKSLVEIAAK